MSNLPPIPNLPLIPCCLLVLGALIAPQSLALPEDNTQPIHIVADESPWTDREKYPKQFDIDELRCIYCGMCEEACPCDAIELTPFYEITGLTRSEMIFDKTKLLEIYDKTIDEKPM